MTHDSGANRRTFLLALFMCGHQRHSQGLNDIRTCAAFGCVKTGCSWPSLVRARLVCWQVWVTRPFPHLPCFRRCGLDAASSTSSCFVDSCAQGGDLILVFRSSRVCHTPFVLALNGISGLSAPCRVSWQHLRVLPTSGTPHGSPSRCVGPMFLDAVLFNFRPLFPLLVYPHCSDTNPSPLVPSL
jgi:hypothetical protein